MSDYQRFVSYLYEYQGNKKSRNCGFCRVEVRNHQCYLELHMKTPPLPFPQQLSVYLFIPQEQQLYGLPIGTINDQQGNLFAHFTFPDQQIQQQPYNFSDLGGLIVKNTSARCYATVWKEISIDPAALVLELPEDPITIASREEPKETILPEKLSELPEEHPDKAVPEHTSVSADPLSVLQKSYPHVQPFFDEEIHNCVQLSMDNLPDLNQKGIFIGTNPFLLHGCQQFNHFLIGQKTEDDQDSHEFLVLCVPTLYNESERFLASFFGFPDFKAASSPRKTNGRFGYWYRRLC